MNVKRPKSILKNHPDNLNHSRKVTAKARFGNNGERSGSRNEYRSIPRSISRCDSERVKTPGADWDGERKTVGGRRSLSVIKQLQIQELERVRRNQVDEIRRRIGNVESGDGPRFTRDYSQNVGNRRDLVIPKPAEYYGSIPKPAKTRTRLLIERLRSGKSDAKPLLSFEEIEASIRVILERNNVRRDTYKSHVESIPQQVLLPRLRPSKPIIVKLDQRHKFVQTLVDKVDSGCQATFVYPVINNSVLVQTEMGMEGIESSIGNFRVAGKEVYAGHAGKAVSGEGLLAEQEKVKALNTSTENVQLSKSDHSIPKKSIKIFDIDNENDTFQYTIPGRPQTAPGLVRGNGKVVISKTNYSDIRLKNLSLKNIGFEDRSMVESVAHNEQAKTADQNTYISDFEDEVNERAEKVNKNGKATKFNESRLTVPSKPVDHSSSPPKSILKRPSVTKREEPPSENLKRDSYRNREFHVDPTLFKHFEKAHQTQKHRLVSLKPKRRAVKVENQVGKECPESIKETENFPNPSNNFEFLPENQQNSQHEYENDFQAGRHSTTQNVQPQMPAGQPQLHYPIAYHPQFFQPIHQVPVFYPTYHQPSHFQTQVIQAHPQPHYNSFYQIPPEPYGVYQDNYNLDNFTKQRYGGGEMSSNSHHYPQHYLNHDQYAAPIPVNPPKKKPVVRRKPVPIGPRTLNYVKTVKVPIRKPFNDGYIPLSQSKVYEREIPRTALPSQLPKQSSKTPKYHGNHAKDSLSKNPKGNFRQLYAPS